MIVSTFICVHGVVYLYFFAMDVVRQVPPCDAFRPQRWKQSRVNEKNYIVYQTQVLKIHHTHSTTIHQLYFEGSRYAITTQFIAWYYLISPAQARLEYRTTSIKTSHVAQAHLICPALQGKQPFLVVKPQLVAQPTVFHANELGGVPKMSFSYERDQEESRGLINHLRQP